MKQKSFFHRDIHAAAPAALLLFFIAAGFVSCASQGAAAQAEEYYSIGMAYFEMGKFSEAEMWLNRARSADKTMTASEYNLGRIAFETGRYEEASRYFETILAKDPDNIIALKAAAYVKLKNGNMAEAETLYNRVLALVPESADDGYNYALLLYGLEKYESCEEVLNRYPVSLEEKPASILLLARTQKALNKVEAVDSYAKWVLVNKEAVNPRGLFEYAEVLETAGHYARALEQYKAAIAAVPSDADILARAEYRFGEAKTLLTADPENEEGMTELELAIEEGFKDAEAVEALLFDDRVTEANKSLIKDIVTGLQVQQSEAQEGAETEESTTSSEDAGEGGTGDGTTGGGA